MDLVQAYSAELNNQNTEMDAGVKIILTVLLAVSAAFCHNGRDLLAFAAFLLVVTIFLKSDLRFILKNLLSFGIIILIPYLIGVLLSLALSGFWAVPAYDLYLSASLIKMTRLFFIWYIGNLYFYTSSLEAIMEMSDRVLGPLKRAGAPVSKYLNMVMFILSELSRTVGQFKGDVFEQAGRIFKDREMAIKSKLKELSNILINYIADSLQRTDEVQAQLESGWAKERQYTLRISKNEILAISGCAIFLLLLFA